MNKKDPMHEFEIRPTVDGSDTLFASAFGQHYHNPNGALAESQHVFFKPLGLIPDLLCHRPITVLEIGFGTGLNLLILTDWVKRLRSKSEIRYMSVEGFMAPTETLKTLNHACSLGLQAPWESFVDRLGTGQKDQNSWHSLGLFIPNITVDLFLGPFEALTTPPAKANVLFHDPFSPESNPEGWTLELFEQLRQWSTEDATLRTYAASTACRQTLIEAGWIVGSAKGALGKREMTLAAHSEDYLPGVKLVKKRQEDYTSST
ncbi:MAG: tRNA (5-methylaminomethyl-2-thiouridine)(34)-methyltransferase MnmD [Bacteroidetes bacterium]|nr:tRNA (5-methylaminomethyl-2-thiouridine)(34)-methyltransferase MnmD [Bacteroidota bacterium]MDA0906936.1 tRNA (5-methylaminomethyl-2-thiouridine)(34)-methyltransferase MnmD [Bacteroidota bacterium]